MYVIRQTKTHSLNLSLSVTRVKQKYVSSNKTSNLMQTADQHPRDTLTCLLLHVIIYTPHKHTHSSIHYSSQLISRKPKETTKQSIPTKESSPPSRFPSQWLKCNHSTNPTPSSLSSSSLTRWSKPPPLSPSVGPSWFSPASPSPRQSSCS